MPHAAPGRLFAQVGVVPERFAAFHVRAVRSRPLPLHGAERIPSPTGGRDDTDPGSRAGPAPVPAPSTSVGCGPESTVRPFAKTPSKATRPPGRSRTQRFREIVLVLEPVPVAEDEVVAGVREAGQDIQRPPRDETGPVGGEARRTEGLAGGLLVLRFLVDRGQHTVRPHAVQQRIPETPSGAVAAIALGRCREQRAHPTGTRSAALPPGPGPGPSTAPRPRRHRRPRTPQPLCRLAVMTLSCPRGCLGVTLSVDTGNPLMGPVVYRQERAACAVEGVGV
ncbi:hypothetical protein SHIRM173S_02829 [Streptomyces hirsutus]